MIGNDRPGFVLGRASPEEIRRDFAERLQKAMVDRGWNQSELARRASESRDNISNYVNGKALPLPHRLRKIADALDMQPAELVPPRGPTSPDAPVFEAKQADSNHVMLRVYRRVTWDQFMRIAEILHEGEEG